MTREDHVTLVVHDNCIRMSRGIVQTLLYPFIVLSVGFACCVAIKHSAVDTSCIIEESADDLLDEIFVFLGE